MKFRHKKLLTALTILSATILVLGVGSLHAQPADYRVTIQNLTQGQPLSPAVGATHSDEISMFVIGELASLELEAIAEDGNQGLMFNRFQGLLGDTVTSVFGQPPGMPPLAPNGNALTRPVMAMPDDVFSLATMLICTNDGFTGLDRVTLPMEGAKVFLLNGYDAGTEKNTEKSKDIVVPCGILGPVPMIGGKNKNKGPDTKPHIPIGAHPVITGKKDLTDAHRWVGPIAKVTITKVDDAADFFLARLNGTGEVPPVITDAIGRARFEFDGSNLHFELNVFDTVGITMAHIHLGLPNENGPVVAFLFGIPGGPNPPMDPFSGQLSIGILTDADLIGPFAGMSIADLVGELRNGNAYVNIHSAQNPSGEIRGQIGTQ